MLITCWLSARGARSRDSTMFKLRHDHYDETTDRRWVCTDDPCLKHHAAPCPDKEHSW